MKMKSKKISVFREWLEILNRYIIFRENAEILFTDLTLFIGKHDDLINKMTNNFDALKHMPKREKNLKNKQNRLQSIVKAKQEKKPAT